MVIPYGEVLGIRVLGIKASVFEGRSIKCVPDVRYGYVRREIPSTQYL